MNPSQGSSSWLGFAAWFLIQVLLLNAVLGAMLFLSTALPIVAANIILVILCVSIVVAAFVFKRASLAWSALITLVAGIIVGVTSREYIEAKNGEIVRDIEITQAAAHPNATGFTFTEGKVRGDLSGLYEERSRPQGRAPTLRFYLAAPVVSEDWDATMSVTVWAVAKTSIAPSAWEKPLKAGLRPPSWDQEGFGRAIALACQSHGLSAPAAAIAVFWVESPEQAIEGLLSEFWFGLKFWNVALVAGLLLGRIAVVASAKKRAAPAEE